MLPRLYRPEPQQNCLDRYKDGLVMWMHATQKYPGPGKILIENGIIVGTVDPMDKRHEIV